jgi:hypothetical protein
MSFSAATVLVAVVAAGTGLAGQTKDQQSCVNDMNKYGERVVKSQDGASHDCVENAGRSILFRLGIPPQAQTAQACLTNDVAGKVAKAMTQLQERDTSRCLSTPGQLPPFGYSGAAATGAAARAASLGIVAGLFGPDLDASIVSAAADQTGVRCQSEVTRSTTDLLESIWKEALKTKKNVLRGSGRLIGSDPDAPVASAVELADELVAAVQGDARGKIAKAALKLHDKVVTRCTGAGTPIAQLFRGSCGTAATLDDLAACAEGLARGAFYQSLGGFDVLTFDCDLTDNGAADLSCESADLREHVLDRIGYGPDAWSRARIQALGVHDYIEEQLSPQTIDDGALDTLLAAFPSLTETFLELRANYDTNPTPPVLPLSTIAKELKQAKVLRAVASHRQLAEVLVDFWQNHFNVAAGSSQRTKYDISPYDRLTIRPNVLGRFEDLLLADARSPAMGDFLDNRLNKVNGINENYAREVLELHTVSVNGPYTESDIPELARCFTGWKENYNNPDAFQFAANLHDQGSKTVMGVQIPPNGGMQDGLTMIDFLAHHQSTAQFISRKLIIRFVSETPPQRLVDEAAGAFLGSGGDIHVVLETILLSPEFLSSPQYQHAKTKRPLVFYASVARALGADPAQLNSNALRNRVADMGEDLYEAGPPTGYPDVSSFWFSPGTAVKRFNDAEAMSRNAYGLAFTYPISGGTSEQVTDALGSMLFVAPLSFQTHDATVGFLDVLPEPNQTKRIQQAAAVLLSSPEFLTH